MRVVGIRQDGAGTDVAALSADSGSVTVLASLASFWADPFSYVSHEVAGRRLPVQDLELVPPVLPQAQVICIGLNYLKHVTEGTYADRGVPPYPTLFARWTRSLTVDGAAVPVPSNEEGLDWEEEVVAWVGATLADATPSEVLDAVVGYSTFNDLTARRAQKLTSQWILGKNGDNSGPLGAMVPAAAVGDLRDPETHGRAGRWEHREDRPPLARPRREAGEPLLCVTRQGLANGTPLARMPRPPARRNAKLGASIRPADAGR
jgi:2-keto-4-pentenoate hydratase/2-oxohepta-3-ene-1,7-dioic acid hydratase in catechol pathway